MSGTFGMKLASQTRPLYSVPLPPEEVVLALEPLREDEVVV